MDRFNSTSTYRARIYSTLHGQQMDSEALQNSGRLIFWSDALCGGTLVNRRQKSFGHSISKGVQGVSEMFREFKLFPDSSIMKC
jgi:hypothetical protein